MSVTDHTEDLSTVPGAMEVFLRRELADGAAIEFEQAPAGWLTKDGRPRLAPWRAYFYVAEPTSRRQRLTSVTTLLDAIMPKSGLDRWAEAQGIVGALEAVRVGEIDPERISPIEAVERVRGLRLGADRARDLAAGRGIDIHAVAERYCVTGDVPRVADFDPGDQGYVRAFASWALRDDPTPVRVEGLVAHPEDGFAGRSDLVATIGGLRTRVDLKTNERGMIYPGSAVQVRLYERAAIWCGDEPCDVLKVVVFAADGTWREMACPADDAAVDAALGWWRALRPINGACEAHNRAERKARRAL